ncbi:copper homeostasis protein [bacterium A37T11]|nr:copper homeostasis protein [bacterium A37T11]
MPEKFLEICAASYVSAKAAQLAGANRVELCTNLQEGGTTPSYGQIAKTVELPNIAVYVLIRPRAGDFCYSTDEFEIMKEDILLCRDLACDGVVIGLLLPNGRVDLPRTRELVELAEPMKVTFHRAFDTTRDPLEALEDIITCGCERILTSGQKNTAEEGKKLIKQLVEKSAGRIRIMVGSGVNADNIATLAAYTGASEFHTSAKGAVPSHMTYQNPDLKNMGAVQESLVGQIRAVMERIKKIKN